MTMDYHIHTLLSDGKQNHEQYIQTALERKINEIGFSDHLCFKKPKWAMQLSHVQSMVDTINSLKKDSDVVVKLGIEMDYLPEYEEKIKEIIESIPFDYVIGSVHFIDDWNFDSEEYISEYEKWDMFELYERYFDLIRQAAESNMFDIIAHLDLIKKFGFRPREDLTDLFRETAKAIAESGACIEVNTSGLDKPCKEIYPSEKLLKVCHEQGIPVALGSDAHAPQEVGRHFDQAIMMMKRVGSEKVVRFTNRQREFMKI